MKRYIIIATLIFSLSLFAEIKIDKIEQLTDSENQYSSPKWSPDCKMIAFVRSDYEGLVVMNSDGTNLKHMVKESVHGNRGFIWSEDSEEIAFRAGSRNIENIKILNIKSGDIRTAITSFTWISYPFWQYSEKGKRVACVNGNGKLLHSEYEEFKDNKFKDTYKKHNFDKNIAYAGGWTKNSKGHDVIINNEGKIISDINLYKLKADWSPNRDKIAYKYNGYIYTINSDGTNIKQLCKGELFSWNPQSDKLVYCVTKHDGHEYSASDLFIIDFDGNNQIKLTDSPEEIEFYPDWSPDGKKIVYSSLKTGNLYLIHLKDF